MFEMSQILVCTISEPILVTGPVSRPGPSPRRPENYEGMMYQTSMKDEISTRTLCAMVKLIGLYVYNIYIYIISIKLGMVINP
jgi:hypothetical protein